VFSQRIERNLQYNQDPSSPDGTPFWHKLSVLVIEQERINMYYLPRC